MKKVLLFVALGCIPLLQARTIKIINNTGATLHVKVSFAGCAAIDRDIKNEKTEEASELEINIGDCCFNDITFTSVDGHYRGKSTKAYGVRAPRELTSCKDALFEVEIKNDKLQWFRK